MTDHGGTSPRPVDPPFSPVLFAGLALAPLPPKVLQPVFDTLLKLVRRRHPDILERLSAYPGARIGIDPVDLPFVLVLTPDPERPGLKVERNFAGIDLSASIRGPLAMLIALGEGKLDGDAAFFSRQLVIEGDTEVVLALRNAVDGAGIDLADDLTAAFGPLGQPLRRAAARGNWLYHKLADDMELVRRALVGQTAKSTAAQSARLAELEDEVANLRRSLRQREVR